MPAAPSPRFAKKPYGFAPRDATRRGTVPPAVSRCNRETGYDTKRDGCTVHHGARSAACPYVPAPKTRHPSLRMCYDPARQLTEPSRFPVCAHASAATLPLTRCAYAAVRRREHRRRDCRRTAPKGAPVGRRRAETAFSQRRHFVPNVGENSRGFAPCLWAFATNFRDLRESRRI